MRSLDVLKQTDWHPLSYSYKLVLLKLVHKAFHDELPQLLSDMQWNALQVTLYERQTLKRSLVSALPMAKTLSLIEAPYYGML